MSPAIVALITQLIQLALTVAPDLVAEAQLAIKFLTSDSDPTPEEQAAIDAALDKANAALEAAVAAGGAGLTPPQ